MRPLVLKNCTGEIVQWRGRTLAKLHSTLYSRVYRQGLQVSDGLESIHDRLDVPCQLVVCQIPAGLSMQARTRRGGHGGASHSATVLRSGTVLCTSAAGASVTVPQCLPLQEHRG